MKEELAAWLKLGVAFNCGPGATPMQNLHGDRVHPGSLPVGHLTVDAGPKSLDELLSVAAAASRSRTPVRFTGTTTRTVEDLMRIAVTGGDCVTFGGDKPRAISAELPARRSWFSLRR